MRLNAQLDWLKTTKYFSVNSRRKFPSWHKASIRAGELANGF